MYIAILLLVLVWLIIILYQLIYRINALATSDHLALFYQMAMRFTNKL